MKTKILEQVERDFKELGPDWFHKWVPKLGHVIQAYCKENKSNKKRLAEKLGVDRPTLYRWINRITVPSRGKIMVLGEILTKSSWQDSLSGRASELLATFSTETREVIRSICLEGAVQLMKDGQKERGDVITSFITGKLNAFIHFLEEMRPEKILGIAY